MYWIFVLLRVVYLVAPLFQPRTKDLVSIINNVSYSSKSNAERRGYLVSSRSSNTIHKIYRCRCRFEVCVLLKFRRCIGSCKEKLVTPRVGERSLSLGNPASVYPYCTTNLTSGLIKESILSRINHFESFRVQLWEVTKNTGRHEAPFLYRFA